MLPPTTTILTTLLTLATLATPLVLRTTPNLLPRDKVTTTHPTGETRTIEIISEKPTPGAPFALPNGQGEYAEGNVRDGGCGDRAVERAKGDGEVEVEFVNVVVEGEGKIGRVEKRGEKGEEEEGPREIKLCCSGFWDCLFKWGNCKTRSQ